MEVRWSHGHGMSVHQMGGGSHVAAHGVSGPPGMVEMDSGRGMHGRGCVSAANTSVVSFMTI